MVRLTEIASAMAGVAMIASSCGGPSPTAANPSPTGATAAAGGTSAAPPQTAPAAPDSPVRVSIAESPVAGPPMEDVVLSPRGRFLAAFCVVDCARQADPQKGFPVPLQLVDLRAGRLHRTLLMAQSSVGGGASAFFSPDDAFLATVQGQGQERLFRTDDGALVREVRLAAVYDNVSFSPDGTRLVFASAFGSTTFLALPDGKVLRAQTYGNPAAVATPIGFAWSADGERFVVTGDHGELRDARTGARIADLPDVDAEQDLVRFAGAGRDLVMATHDCTVQLLHPETGAPAETLRTPAADEECEIAASRDGASLLIGTAAGIEIFDIASRAKRLLPSPGHPERRPVPSLDGKWIAQMRFAESDAGRQGTSPRAAVHVFDVEKGGDPARLDADLLLGWSASGNVYGLSSGELVGWSPAGKEVFRASFETPALDVELSDDGRLIAITDGQLVLIRTADHRVLRVAITDEKGTPRVAGDASEIASFVK